MLFISLAVLMLAGLMKAEVQAQISKGGQPYSYQKDKAFGSLPMYQVAAPSMEGVEASDAEDEKNGMPYRVAFNMPVHFDFFDYAQKEIIGDRLVWALEITSQGAKALNVYYENFILPADGLFFVYSSQYDYISGAFSQENNRPSGLFATAMIPGDKMVLEYSEPLSSGMNTPRAVIRISDIGYHYRGAASLTGEKIDESEFCEVNINCPEGDNWQNEKKGVVKLVMKEGSASYLCSGSLINNTAQDLTPYLLTAYHCSASASAADKEMWVFYFNYEREGCENTGTAPTTQSLTGCTMVARGPMSGGTDFQLLLLHESPPKDFNPVWNGWDRSITPSSSGVSIHHPAGDIKKISTYTTTLSIGNWSSGMAQGHWRVYWAATQTNHGVTEGGSSGSPLFNNDHKIIGTLTGGGSYCTSPNVPDYYGRFDKHWNANGSTALQQLAPWLDPCNSDVSSLNSLNYENFSDAPDSVIVSPLANGSLKVNLKKKNPSDFIVVAYSEQNIVVNLVDGTSYSSGNTLQCNGQTNGTIAYVGNDESCIITGLQPDTEYFVKVWAGKSANTYSLGKPSSCVTVCQQSQPLTYEIAFSGSQHDCWLSVNNGGAPNNVWQFGTSSNIMISGHTGQYAYIDSYKLGSWASQNADLISPVFDLSEYENVFVRFTHRYRQRNNSIASFQVSIDNGNSWQTIQSYTEHSENPAVFDQEVSQYAALQENVMFKFNYIGSNGWYWAITDFKISGYKVGIQENNPENDFLLFPNPARSLVTVLPSDGLADNQIFVEFFSVTGQKVLSQDVDFSSGPASINIGSLSKGIYFVKFISDNATVTKRIVVE